MRTIFQIILLFAVSNLIGQGSIKGAVTDSSTGDPVMFATVAIYQDGEAIMGTDTDFDGNYFLGDLPFGTYILKVSFVGYENVNKPIVVTGHETFDVVMKDDKRIICCLYITNCFSGSRLLDFDNTTSGQIINVSHRYKR